MSTIEQPLKEHSKGQIFIRSVQNKGVIDAIKNSWREDYKEDIKNNNLIKELKKPSENFELTFNVLFKNSKPRNFNIPYLNIADNLLLNYLVNNLSKETIEKIPNSKFDLKSIITADYYLRFNPKDCIIRKILNESDLDGVVDYCSNNIRNCMIANSKKINIDSYEKYNINPKYMMLLSAYNHLIDNNGVKTLIKDSKDINDLKAILFMDFLFKNIKNTESISKKKISLEQKAIEFARIYSNNKGINNNEFINPYQQLINKLNKLNIVKDVTPVAEINFLLNKQNYLKNIKNKDLGKIIEIKKKINQIKQRDASIIESYISHYQNKTKDLPLLEAIKVSKKLGYYERVCRAWGI